MSSEKADEGVQGEGDHVAGRRFQDAEQAFVKKGLVDRKAREAAEAIDGAEADDLEAARRSSASGDIHGAAETLPPEGERT
jgi:hypothetical protein